MSPAHYQALRADIISCGYGHEVEWAQSVQPVSDALTFWGEFSWVVLNSGMRNQVAQGIWKRVRPAVLAGQSAATVFGHKGKAAAIDHVYQNREVLLQQYLSAADKLAFIQDLPWIGPITCKHLAKNYGFDCAKADRHLVRVAGQEGVDTMCRRLADASGDRVATVDLVIWRAANLGLV